MHIKSKITIKIVIIVTIIFAGLTLYFVTEVGQKNIIERTLKNNLDNLRTHYEILLYHQRILAQTTYEETLEKPEFMHLYSKIALASIEQRAVMRESLIKLLEKKYKRLQQQGVLQYHFTLANNESFLRMHKQNKFGDNLSDIRLDFKYVNETKLALSAFTQGRVAHGFRNVFPILDINGIHLGAMEISFSSDDFQHYLANISKMHTHFLLDKSINNAKLWLRDDTIVKYIQSPEHDDLMISITKEHDIHQCIKDSISLLKPVRKALNQGIENEEAFSLALGTLNTHREAVSFLPIKNFNGTKTLAWFVSYAKSDLIKETEKITLLIRIISFIVIILLGHLIYKFIIKQRDKVLSFRKKAYIDGLTGIYNRNKFDERVKKELLRSERYKRNLGMVIIDIDYFKRFNDTYGHLIGDEILITLAQKLNSKVRNTDTFARWGGEEFVILFPETDKKMTEIICEKLRLEIEKIQHPTAGTITASFGVTNYIQNDTLESMFTRCDEALYEAKENGRNTVCVK